MRERLRVHMSYETCVRRNALSLANQEKDGPEILAKAALSFSSTEERALWSRTRDQCEALGDKGEALGKCTDETMTKWREAAEREAFACVSAARFKPEMVAVSVCKEPNF